MSRQQTYISMEHERDPLNEIEVIMKKIHRKSQHKQFLLSCRENNVFPRFTFIKQSVVRKLNMKKTRNTIKTSKFVKLRSFGT